MADVIPSEELRSLLLRLYATWEAHDLDSLSEMISAQPHALVIGTDPAEWWSGSDALRVWLIQVRELGRITIKSSEAVAYCCGNVGWVADRPVLTLENGVTVSPRITAVAVIERGHWRFAQWHSSVGQTNEQSLGFSLTTSIEDIARSVEAERPDVRPASAPDGTVTIVFSDIESSTVLLERLGDTAFLSMLAWHDDIVRNASDKHRGYVVKSQGDGFMLAFPSAAFALRASVVMRDQIADGFRGCPFGFARACIPAKRSDMATTSTAGRLSSQRVLPRWRWAGRSSPPTLCTRWHGASVRSLLGSRAPRRSKVSPACSSCTPCSPDTNDSGLKGLSRMSVDRCNC